MATPRTVNTWPLNGTQREFDLTFDYLSRNFVKVTILGGPLPIPLTQGTDFVFVTNTRIRTTVAYGAPNTLIEIRRVTSTTERLVEFQDASILHALDLNIDALQVLHVAEEAREAATETIGVNNDGHLDARGRRIVNVQDPVAPQDVATKNYVDTAAGGVGAARDQAIAARDAAQGHANQAGVHSNNALARANAAAGSATQAAQSATTSINSAAASKASEDAAKLSENASFTHKNDALAASSASSASALKAKEWAEKMPGPVESGAYSAKYWAQQASALALPDGYISQQKLDGALSAKVNNGQAAFDRNWRENSIILQQDTNPSDVMVSGQYDMHTIHGPADTQRRWYYLEVQQHSNQSIYARQRITLMEGGGANNGMVWERVVIPGGGTTKWRAVALTDLPNSMYTVYDMTAPSGAPVSSQWLSIRRDGTVRQGGTFVIGTGGPVGPRITFRQPVTFVKGISCFAVGGRAGTTEANSTLHTLDNSGFSYNSGYVNSYTYVWSMEGYLAGLI